MLTHVLLSALTFASALTYDWVEASYVRAVADLEPHRAARMSVAMYGVGCVGFFVTLKISLWYMGPEILGLYAGSLLAVRSQRRRA